MADLNSQISRRLTDSQAIYTKPAWSPDGKRIAYISIPPTGEEREDAGVYVMQPDGANRRRISSMSASGAVWSPDGKMIVWIDGRKNAITIYDFESNKTVATLKRDSFDCPYFWSQDSQRLLSSCGGSFELSTMKFSNFPSTIDAREAFFSSNEKYLAYVKKIENVEARSSSVLQAYQKKFDSNPNILLVMQNGTVVYKSDYWIRNVYEPVLAWSPNGEILVFRKYVEDFNEPDIVFLHVPTVQIALLEAGGIYPLFWSPSGRKIAYKTDEDTIEVIEFEFHTNPFSFTITDRLSFPLNKSSSGDSFDDWLVWSPDENQIASVYHKYKENFGEAVITYPGKIWLVDLKTGAQAPLVGTP